MLLPPRPNVVKEDSLPKPKLLFTTKPTNITNASIAPTFIDAPDKNNNINTPVKLLIIDVAIVNGCANEFSIAASNMYVNITANINALPISVVVSSWISDIPPNSVP